VVGEVGCEEEEEAMQASGCRLWDEENTLGDEDDEDASGDDEDDSGRPRWMVCPALIEGGQLDRSLTGFESHDKIFASSLELRHHVTTLNSIPSHRSFFPPFFLPTTSSACFCHPSYAFCPILLIVIVSDR
jgi:hypothetical protein